MSMTVLCFFSEFYPKVSSPILSKYSILYGYVTDPSLPLTLDRTEGYFKAEEYPGYCIAQDMRSIPELMISEMVQLTRSTRIHQNGKKTDLGQTLYRVQALLSVFPLFGEYKGL